MNLSTILNSVDKYIKIKPWLQFVGYMLAFGGLVFIEHPIAKVVAFLGLGVSMAGYLYEKIYP
jgi:hypothetical protein